MVGVVDQLGNGISTLEEARSWPRCRSTAHTPSSSLAATRIGSCAFKLDAAEAVEPRAELCDCVSNAAWLREHQTRPAGIDSGAAGGVGSALLQEDASRAAADVRDVFLRQGIDRFQPRRYTNDYQHQDFVTEFAGSRTRAWTSSSTASVARTSGVPARPYVPAGQSWPMALPRRFMEGD